MQNGSRDLKPQRPAFPPGHHGPFLQKPRRDEDRVVRATRGRMDRANVLTGHAPKLVYVYPLGRDVQTRLRTAPAPAGGAPAEDAL